MGIVLTQSYGVSSGAQFFTILLVFIFVLIITYLTTRFVGKFQKVQSLSSNFESIEAYKLNNNNYLQLVRIGDKYYVLSVSKDNTSLICEVEKEQLDLESKDQSVVDGFAQLYTRAKEKFSDRGDTKNE